MKKYIVFILILFAAMTYSCKKYLTEVNTDPNQFSNASPAAILQGCFKATTDFMAKDNGERWWDLGHIVQAGARYDLTGDNVWKPMYINVLEGIDQVKQRYGADSAYNNQVQIARIWESYAYYLLVANYGPVAQSQALSLDYQSDILYDSEDTVYTRILNTLQDAVSKINVSHTSDKLAYDVIFDGDLTKWIKFGNTLRLEIALTCRRNLGGVADAHIKEVMANDAMTINAEGESVKVPYENVTNNRNPYYQRYKFDNNTLPAPVMSDFVFLYFRSYKDPRLDAYFDSVPMRNRYLVSDTLLSKVDDSIRIVTYPIPHFGRPESPSILATWTSLAGQISPMGGTSDTSYSHMRGFGYGGRADPMPGNSLVAADAPFTLLSYAQSEFLKAEAAQLGLGGSMSAEQFYQQGIAANFAHWELSGTQLTEYMNRDGVKWGTKGDGFYDYLGNVKADIPEDNLAKIWIQSWLNCYPDQMFDAWTLQRRTRVLDLPPMTNPGSGYINEQYMDIPDRTPYPKDNVKLNPKGYADALEQLGIGGSVNDWFPYVQLNFEKPFKVRNWDAATPHYNMDYVQKWYGNTIQSLDSAGVPYTVVAAFSTGGDGGTIEMNLPRDAWVLTGNTNPNNLFKAIDGDITTRWDSGPQLPGQFIQVDMGTTFTIHSVVLDQATSAGDSPVGYEVYVGMDANNFGSPVASGVGTRDKTVVDFDPVEARFVKIVQTGSRGSYWSVHELNIVASIKL